MKSIIFISFTLSIAVGMISCRKDKVVPAPSGVDNCTNFENLPSLTFFTKGRFQYQTPYFNPNNLNEFVFNYKDFELEEYELVKYNIQTGVKTIIAENVNIISQPKWSRKGWVAVDNVYNQNYQLWIVKDNGDSLIQKSISGGNIFPSWDSTGEYLYWQYSPNIPPAFPYYFFKQGLYSSFTDTIMRDCDINHGYAGYSDISIDNILLTNTSINNEIHFAYAPLSSLSFTSIFNNLSKFNTDFMRGVSWSNNSQIGYFTFFNNSSSDGLYKININSGTCTKLLDFCNSKRYQSISCSSDGKKLLGERVDSYLVKDGSGNPTGQIVENSSIYIIDLETLKETKINLD